MKQSLTLIFIFNIYFLSAQTQVDTLVIGNNKLKLIKSETFYDLTQDGPVMLISEYQKETSEAKINYKTFNRFGYFILQELEAGMSGVTITDSGFYREIKILNVSDSILLKKSDLKFVPFIKSSNLTNYLCGVEICLLRNDTLTKYNIKSTDVPLELSFTLFEGYEDKIQIMAGDILYLTNIYYRKNSATFYLDRTIIIKIN